MNSLVRHFTAFATIFVTFAANGAINEVVRRDGQMRSSYRAYERSGRQLFPITDERFQALSAMPLGDSIRIFPVPLVLTNADYARIQEGARQRGRALSAFFVDVVFNNARQILASGLLTQKQLQALFVTDGKVTLDGIRGIYQGARRRGPGFMLGSDVVRTDEGYRVLEDNVGSLGGLGDIAKTHEFFNRLFGLSKPVHEPLREMVLHFLKDIPRDQWNKVIAVLYHGGVSNSLVPEDDEDQRRRQILEDLGISVIAPSAIDEKFVEAVANGQFKKIVNITEPMNLGINNALRMRLLNLFREGKVEFMVDPGTEMLGNKALLPFTDKLIQLYLGETVLLPTQKTEWVTADTPVYINDMKWVYKSANGLQGDEVWITRFMSEQNRKNLAAQLREATVWSRLREGEELPAYIRQEWTDQSYIPASLPDSWMKFNIDLRPMMYVRDGEVGVRPMLWGRAAQKATGVLTNVSQGAYEMVVTTPDDCLRVLKFGDAGN